MAASGIAPPPLARRGLKVPAAPLLCAVRAVSAVARLSVGPVLPLLAADLELSVAAKGRLLSAFSGGYLLTQVAGGSVADACGAKAVVSLALLATAAGLAALPASAAAAGADGLGGVFFALGLVNGPLFPACSVMLRDVPSRSRSRSMAIVDAGGTLGGCLATAICPAVAVRLGWQQLYQMLAMVAVGVAVLWVALSVDPPPVASSIKEGKEPTSALAALGLFAFAGPWALFWAHSVFNYANYFLNAWLPTMFVERFQEFDAATAGAYLMWPEVAGVVSRFAMAALADRCLLQAGRMSLRSVRRGASALAFSLQGVVLVSAVRQQAPLPCTLLLTVASVAASLHSCGFKANYLDLTTEHGGVLAGVGNTLASLASAAGPVVTSTALASAPGDWHRLFIGLLLLNCTGAVVVLLFLSTDSLDTAVALRPACGCWSRAVARWWGWRAVPSPETAKADS